MIFELFLKRIFLIIKSNSEELLNSLKENKKNLNHIISTDLTINKLCYYCIRILNKKGYKNYREIPMIYSLILTLENIGDIHKNIAKEVIEGKLKLTKTDLKNLELSNELFYILETIFFKRDVNDIILLAKKYEILKKRLTGYSSKMNLHINNLLLNIMTINNNLLMII